MGHLIGILSHSHTNPLFY